MGNQPDGSLRLPSAGTIHQAVDLYLRHAYTGGEAPVKLRAAPPKGEFDPGKWLMGDAVERTPDSQKIEEVRVFSLRLGNIIYRHMKLCICRTGSEPVYLFMVDAHDAVLEAAPGSSDQEALEELKRRNIAIASEINAAWDAAGIRTERGYLREKVRRAKGEGR